MNGIFAYHPAASGPTDNELVTTRDHMRARGPDGHGVWWSADRRCAFGHRRLSIIDLSAAARQPMISADGSLVITFNGEIYNYRELRAELKVDGVQFRTQSDTEVLLHLYARCGMSMTDRLRGMYAFAIWDGLRSGIFLARDPYGIKPLYTANDGWTFRFASQVKALLAGGKVSRDPEPAGIVGFHLFGSVPEPVTLYRDIRALPAGHMQWIDAGGPREPVPHTRVTEIIAAAGRTPAPREELSERVRNGLLDSVRAHMLADVEVGIFLSAGVDSGALLGGLHDVGQRQVRAITLAFDEFRGTPEDEGPLAARLAARYHAEQIFCRVSEADFHRDLPAILDSMDQPSIDGVNTWFVAKRAKEVGLKVALSGLGGDELLGGYPSFTTLARWRRRFGVFALLPGFGWAARTVLSRFLRSWVRAHPKAPSLIEYAGSWPALYMLQRGLFLPHELSEFLEADVLREGLRRLQPIRGLRASLAPDPGSDVGRVSVLESSHYMRNQLLRDSDWAGMAHGVEIRVPFVDLAFLETVAPCMPTLVRNAGKIALAQAPSLPLPSEVVSRGKTGFNVPTGAWLDKKANSSALLSKRKGLVSRNWSRFVFDSATVAFGTGV